MFTQSGPWLVKFLSAGSPVLFSPALSSPVRQFFIWADCFFLLNS
ncbi:MAG: hypothetical protein OP8BY_1330 [Candidatus Saccharicenans subterraneus]|uniref:Uncharacterized protein n=1 Tax=Candidatus Saccharicenans subterraneus TaxID=2508984 RepID=A0A3E2BPZ6_9BACT|nr:MAG: hypothetical protein OP8BY_1330 [Candidatus Saccharicenans subterraneum]